MTIPLDSFRFGDTAELADELAALVLAGKKTATCWAAVEGQKTEAGRRWIVERSDGHPLAVIETLEVTQRRFDEVDAAFAYDEGEDDRSLAAWRDAHREYFTRLGQFGEEMLLWCERFRLIEIL